MCCNLFSFSKKQPNYFPKRLYHFIVVFYSLVKFLLFLPDSTIFSPEIYFDIDIADLAILQLVFARYIFLFFVVVVNLSVSLCLRFLYISSWAFIYLFFYVFMYLCI